MITQYDSFLNGYNMTPGGYTRNISGENNPMWGKKHTEETKEKNRLANRGENNPGYGKCRTNETKEKIRVANLGDKNPRYGKPGTMLGKTMSNCSRELIRISKIGTTSSEETKEKLRIARRGKTPARSHIWKIYRTNNRIDLTDHRKEWCVDNGYSDSQLSSLFHGKIKHYKDIIKVEKLT
jgi:ribosomal protein L39E